MNTETEIETYGGPFAIDDVTEPDRMGITKAVAARALAEAGWPYKQASIFWRNAVARGLLHPYRRQMAAARPHFLFRPEAVLTAAVLMRLNEAGFAGDAVMQRASLALSAWRAEDFPDGDRPPMRNPGSFVIGAYMGGFRGFGFELVTARHKDSGLLEQHARVRHIPTNTGTDFHIRPEFIRRSLFVFDLDSILEHIFRDKGMLN